MQMSGEIKVNLKPGKRWALAFCACWVSIAYSLNKSTEKKSDYSGNALPIGDMTCTYKHVDNVIERNLLACM